MHSFPTTTPPQAPHCATVVQGALHPGPVHFNLSESKVKAKISAFELKKELVNKKA